MCVRTELGMEGPMASVILELLVGLRQLSVAKVPGIIWSVPEPLWRQECRDTLAACGHC